MVVVAAARRGLKDGGNGGERREEKNQGRNDQSPKRLVSFNHIVTRG